MGSQWDDAGAAALGAAARSAGPVFAPSAGEYPAGDGTAADRDVVCVWRWQVEVTYHETRTHLGRETQRQWSERAIARTTPILLVRFSVVTVFAHALLAGRALPVWQSAWYTKPAPTFADTLAFVRQQLWPSIISAMSPPTTDVVKIPRAAFHHITETLAYAA